MAAPLLSLRNIALSTGGKTLFENANLTVGEGERLCLVGRNGTGKSTFLKIAAGLIEPDKGERVMQSGTTIRYLPQEPDLSGFANTLAYVEAGLGPMDDHYRAQMLLESLGLTGQEDPHTLSGGEARRCALARTLAPEPDILLLDEPTNHLDLPIIEWLESELQGSRSAYVLISHDRRFLEKLARSTLWLDRGHIRRMEQGFGAFEGWRDTVLEQEEIEQHKLERKIAMEEDWLRYGVTARRKRNVRRLGQLHSLRQEKREHQGPQGGVKLAANESETSGKMVFEAKNIFFGYEGRPIVQGFSTRITRGDRVALVGPNGAGKTTLLKLLTGVLAPDSGFVRQGKNVDMATLDQGRVKLDPNSTLIESISAGNGETITINGQNRHIMGYMKDFLFSPDQANASVSILSGGERGRLLLARALSLPSNVMVLDEPTNDLDLETLDLLQELITDYPGTVLLVSHDRDFIDRVATSTIVFEGNAVWREYPGGYTDSVNQRGKGVETRAKPAQEKSAPKSTHITSEKKAQPKSKLSQKESYALQSLPKQMEKLQADITALQAKLDAPDLYTKDPALFAKTAEAITRAQAELAACEEQWLELEMLREELEG